MTPGCCSPVSRVLAGLIDGDPIDPAIAAGLLCALVGCALTAWSAGARGDRGHARRGAVVLVGGAVGVATMLTCFHAAGRLDPYWATAAEHASTAVSAGLIALVSAGSDRRALPRRAQLPALLTASLAGVAGDVAYAAASRHAALSIVSAISSLYPVATIVLGVIVQRHRPSRVQALGIVLALVGGAVLGATAG
jgi:drug/metabolite transporter (DMT)-like permease